MDQKKILIVSRSFYPENSPRSLRTTTLAKEFASQGHDVTVLTLKNHDVHELFEKENGITIKDIGPLRFPATYVTKSSGVWGYLNRAIRRGMLLLFEYPNIELMFSVNKALQKESGYDLLISIAVPHPIHWGVAWAWRNKNPIANLWVADCGDPYMGQTLDSFNKMFYFKYFEKDFCRKADYISVPLENAKEGYYPEFRDKIEVIPQGVRFDEIKIDHSAYSKHQVPTFAYAGSFIPGGRDPRPFFDYLISIDHDFKFIIYTKSIVLVEPWLDRANGKIEIRDYIPRKELLKVLSKMDFLVNFENRSSLMMPSKLIDYYLTGRPILNISANNIDTNMISHFLNGHYREKYIYSNMEQYKIENVCQHFLNLSGNKKLNETVRR